MWTYHYWYNLPPCPRCSFHWNFLLPPEWIHPLVVCPSCYRIVNPNDCWCCILHQILHQGPRKHQNSFDCCHDSVNCVFHSLGYLESLLFPMAIQIWCCICWCWFRRIYPANQERLHGMELIHCYLPWFHLRLFPLRCHYLFHCLGWQKTRGRNGRCRWCTSTKIMVSGRIMNGIYRLNTYAVDS